MFGNVYLQNTSEFPCGHLFSSQRFFFVFLSLINSKGKINPKKLFKVQYTTRSTPDLTVSIPLSLDLQPTGHKKKKKKLDINKSNICKPQTKISTTLSLSLSLSPIKKISSTTPQNRETFRWLSRQVSLSRVLIEWWEGRIRIYLTQERRWSPILRVEVLLPMEISGLLLMIVISLTGFSGSRSWAARLRVEPMVKGARVLLIGLGIVRGGEKISRRIIITVRFSFYSFLLLFFF